MCTLCKEVLLSACAVGGRACNASLIFTVPLLLFVFRLGQSGMVQCRHMSTHQLPYPGTNIMYHGPSH